MEQTDKIRSFTSQQRQRAARSYQWIASQPSWVMRLALLSFFIVVVLPIMLLVFIAVAAMVLVFGSLAAVNVLFNKLKNLLPTRDGRSNVKVIRRD